MPPGTVWLQPGPEAQWGPRDRGRHAFEATTRGEEAEAQALKGKKGKTLSLRCLFVDCSNLAESLDQARQFKAYALNQVYGSTFGGSSNDLHQLEMANELVERLEALKATCCSSYTSGA